MPPNLFTSPTGRAGRSFSGALPFLFLIGTVGLWVARHQKPSSVASNAPTLTTEPREATPEATEAPKAESGRVQFLDGLGNAFQSAQLQKHEDVFELTVPQGTHPPKKLSLPIPKNPAPRPFSELLQALEASRLHQRTYDLVQYNCVDFASALYKEGIEKGFDPRFVGISFRNETTGHALVAFRTSDQGWVYVDFTPAFSEGEPAHGQLFQKRLTWIEPGFQPFSERLDEVQAHGFKNDRAHFLGLYDEKERLLTRLRRLQTKLEVYADNIQRSARDLESGAVSDHKHLQEEIASQSQELSRLKNQIAEAEKNHTMPPSDLSALVARYNQEVVSYNDRVSHTRATASNANQFIADHNKLVNEMNSLKSELAPLVKKLNEFSLTDTTGKIVEKVWQYPSVEH